MEKCVVLLLFAMMLINRETARVAPVSSTVQDFFHRDWIGSERHHRGRRTACALLFTARPPGCALQRTPE